ncbi:MAG: Protein TolB [Anaerolineales bacterium]|nr:Protein TolB [Anaerolineales bacterium]
MRKPFTRLTLIIPLLLILSSCLQPGEDPSTPQAFSQTPSTADSALPISSGARETLIFSIEEDGYAHLFAFIPNQMPLTRLTGDKWDDITPAISPDGTRIAFASNRSGYWDLYLFDASNGEVTRLTDTPEYEGAPTWSPDGSFLAFEAYLEDSLEVVIGPAGNPREGAILLTSSATADHSPAWSPGGRQIVFVSDGEIILADLDKTDDTRYANLSNTADAAESHPVWSQDGTRLMWAASSQNVGRSGIYLWDSTRNAPAVWVADGDYPAWNPSGDNFITTFNTPNETYLANYSLDGNLLEPLATFPSSLRGFDWANLTLAEPLPAIVQQTAGITPAPLWVSNFAASSEGAGRDSLVSLNNVQAPYPQLSDRVDEAFNALRERVILESGWDALASLENAYVPITTALDPGFEESWLYTGRAFAINSLMTNAGWMVAAREDYGAQTYWRLYIRAQAQDGSLGEPLRANPWDLSARYNLDPKVYEQGGKYSAVPAGYWVDVTALALQYGWQRVPALPNWRTFYRGARFTEFALTDGLDFYSALLQLYPPDVLLTPTRLLPPTFTPTVTSTFTPTITLTRTPRITQTTSLTPTITRTTAPTTTPIPTNTIMPTVTPPTIIP